MQASKYPQMHILGTHTHTHTYTLYLSADATAHHLISSTDSQGTHTCALYLSADDATASATEFIQKLELDKTR